MTSKYIYFHTACIGIWEEVVTKIYNSIKASGLYDEVKEIRCSVIGDKDEFLKVVNNDSKYKIIFNSNEKQFLSSNWATQRETLNLNELFKDTNSVSWKDILESGTNLWKRKVVIPTDRPIHNEEIIITKLHEHSLQEDFQVLYIHSKGVKRSVTEPELYPMMSDWLDCLIYFYITEYKTLIKELDEFDVSGINLSRFPGKYKDLHYGGNFFWTNSKYIRKLKTKLCQMYRGPEIWITQRLDGNFISLWNDEVDHYTELYPPSEYKNKPLQRHIVKGRQQK